LAFGEVQPSAIASPRRFNELLSGVAVGGRGSWGAEQKSLGVVDVEAESG